MIQTVYMIYETYACEFHVFILGFLKAQKHEANERRIFVFLLYHNQKQTNQPTEGVE